MFSGGYHRLILGRITTLPTNYVTWGLQCGSFGATHFPNGKRRTSKVLFYGFMENVCYCLALRDAFAETECFIFCSRRREERFLVRQAF